MEKHDFEKELVYALPQMLRYAMQLTCDEDRAHDLVQDATVKALLKYTYYIDDNNLNGWLHTIIYHTFLNNKKHSSYSVNVSDESFFEQPFLDTACDAREVLRAVGMLPIPFRVPLEMFAQGYSYCEIAASMNIPLGTVKSRISKARVYLRKYLME